MQFIYRIQPVRWDHLSGGATAEEEVIVDRHFAYLQGLTDRGVVLLAARTLTTDAASFGIILFEAEGEAEGEAEARRRVDKRRNARRAQPPSGVARLGGNGIPPYG